MAVELQIAVPKPASQNVKALRQVLATINAESCPTAYNFHMHTIHSDGQLQPEMLMQQAIAIGLAGFAITDHHTVNGYRLAQRWLDEQPQLVDTPRLPHLWVGVEVSAQLLETEVHILGYAFDPDNAAMQPYLQQQAPQGQPAEAGTVIAAIQTAGGLAVLAHPVRYRRSPELLIAEAANLGINGVETYYAYDNPNPWRSSPKQTQRVHQLGTAYQLLNTCGTDTHGRNLLQRL